MLLAGPQQASAGWVASGGGGPAAAATALSPGPLPTLSRNGLTGTVTVSWPAVTLAGQPVTGYVVRRYSATGPSPVTSGTCTGGPVSGTGTAGVVTTTSCTDTRGWTTQTYAYRVVPVFREWLGAESPAASI
ncbi:hypothetical protein ACI8AK_14725 [Geodermatophilus sp. SYSU D00867]